MYSFFSGVYIVGFRILGCVCVLHRKCSYNCNQRIYHFHVESVKQMNTPYKLSLVYYETMMNHSSRLNSNFTIKKLSFLFLHVESWNGSTKVVQFFVSKRTFHFTKHLAWLSKWSFGFMWAPVCSMVEIKIGIDFMYIASN